MDLFKIIVIGFLWILILLLPDCSINPASNNDSNTDACSLCTYVNSIKLEPKQWHLISFPSYKIPVNNLIIPDKERMKVFYFDTDSARYEEVSPADTFYPGIGYFLITRYQEDTIQYLLDSFQVYDNAELEINLKAGNNILGNPYPYDVKIPDSNYTFLAYNDSVYQDSIHTIHQGAWDTLRKIIPAWSGFLVECEDSGRTIKFLECDCP